MPPPLLHPPTHKTLTPHPLTPPRFSPYGTAISAPLPQTHQTIPLGTPPLPPIHPTHQPDYVIANQRTALKYAPISPLLNTYPGPSTPLMSMFISFPRNLTTINTLPITILERHPFTTQTFTPLGLAPDSPDTSYLVVVAPSLRNPAPATSSSGSTVSISNPPDLQRIEAFVAHGGQAVTYAAGTWHAPMMVLGRRRVEFVVSQFVSGIADEDCQEVAVGPGVGVDVTGLPGSEVVAKL